MAKLKYGATVEPFKGKREGFSFQTGHYYPVVNSKKKNDRNRYGDQFNKMQFVVKATRLWRTLSSSQKQEWNDWSTFLQEPSRLRPDVVLNGYNLFVRRHVYWLLQNGIDAGVMPVGTPGIVTLPNSEVNVYLISGKLYLDLTNFFLPYRTTLFVFLTPPVSVGKYYAIRRRKYLLWTVGFTTTIDITDLYIAAFGQLPYPGCVIFSVCNVSITDSAIVYKNVEFDTVGEPARNPIT